MMNNLHVVLNEFRSASRVLKQVTSIAAMQGIQHVYIAALHDESLKSDEVVGENVFLKRFFLKTRGLGNGITIQLIKYIEYVFMVLFFYRNKNIRMVNVHSLGLLPMGYVLKCFYSAILVYDAHELETEKNGLRGVRKKLAKFVERIFIKKADHVVVVSENIADWYQNEYGVVRPTVVLNAPIMQEIGKNQYFRSTFNLRDDQVIALYQGGLVSGRGVNLLLQAFSQRADDRVVIVFMGYGDLEAEIKDAASKFNTIFFHNAVPPDGLLEYTVSADIGISFIENNCLSYYYCMPNKLFEYLMAGLPVVVSDMKEMREFVEKYNVGWALEGGSIDSVAKAIANLTPDVIGKYKKNTRVASLENSWEHQERKMLVEYKFLLGEK